MMRLHTRILALTIIMLTSACEDSTTGKSMTFYTWEGIEPDKWASVWLIKRHIYPDATLLFIPVGSELGHAVAFDTPEARYRRVHGKSTFEALFSAFGEQSDTALVKTGAIINSLEVNPWAGSTPLVAAVEYQFRALQQRYQRTEVPVDCYLNFFDALYEVLSIRSGQAAEAVADTLQDILAPVKICDLPLLHVAANASLPVLEYPITTLLNMINAGKQIVFVDTREDEEFDEHHIPGAINIKLREVNNSVADALKEADLVISYCVKDFRGYEVALALSKAGVPRSGIMKPYGIKGWKEMGLPVAGDTVTESVALDTLKQCAERGGCEDSSGS